MQRILRGILQLVSCAIIAGTGSTAILKGYVKGSAVREQASRAEMYRKAAADASKGVDVKDRLDELENADKVTMRRWGPR
ncbi:MAG: hypothetical protein ACETWT_18430 [Thermodesulfobacteriota bacterium]